MESTSKEKRSGLRREWLALLPAGILLVIWLWFTPPGFIGKVDAIAYAVCHRIDARSFHFDGIQFPLCARCTGMYLGAILGLVYQLLQGRRGGMPSIKVFIVLGVLVLAFGIDGANSYLHFFPKAPSLYVTTNLSRLLTGTGMGLALSAVVLPAFHQTMWLNWNENRALGSWRQLGGLLLLALLMDALIMTQNPVVLYPAALIGPMGILVILSMVYGMVMVMLFRRENHFVSSRQLWLPLLAGFTIALLQIGLMDWGRFLLTGTWAGFNL